MLKNKTLKQVQSIMDKLEDGLCSEAVAMARLQVLMAKDRQKSMKQSENSNLPTEVRMGCSKKGYTRQTSLTAH